MKSSTHSTDLTSKEEPNVTAPTDKADTWDPEAEKTLDGYLEGLEEIDLAHGPVSVALIRDDGGKLRGLRLSHKVLKNEWTKAEPEEGDRVSVSYEGERDGKRHSYYMYNLDVEPQ